MESLETREMLSVNPLGLDGTVVQTNATLSPTNATVSPNAGNLPPANYVTANTAGFLYTATNAANTVEAVVTVGSTSTQAGSVNVTRSPVNDTQWTITIGALSPETGYTLTVTEKETGGSTVGTPATQTFTTLAEDPVDPEIGGMTPTVSIPTGLKVDGGGPRFPELRAQGIVGAKYMFEWHEINIATGAVVGTAWAGKSTERTADSTGLIAYDIDSALAEGKTYEFRVVAMAAENTIPGRSASIFHTTGFPEAPAPGRVARPTLAKANAEGNAQNVITATWTQPTGIVPTEYEVIFQRSGGSEEKFIVSGRTTSLSYAVPAASNTYRVEVVAIANGARGERSDYSLQEIVTVMPVASSGGGLNAAAPTGVTATLGTGVAATTATVSWTAGVPVEGTSSAPVGYIVYYGSPASSPTLYASVYTTSTSVQIANLIPGTWSFRVEAVGNIVGDAKNGNSAAVAAASTVVVPTPAPAPTAPLTAASKVVVDKAKITPDSAEIKIENNAKTHSPNGYLVELSTTVNRVTTTIFSVVMPGVALGAAPGSTSILIPSGLSPKVKYDVIVTTLDAEGKVPASAKTAKASFTTTDIKAATGKAANHTIVGTTVTVTQPNKVAADKTKAIYYVEIAAAPADKKDDPDWIRSKSATVGADGAAIFADLKPSSSYVFRVVTITHDEATGTRMEIFSKNGSFKTAALPIQNISKGGFTMQVKNTGTESSPVYEAALDIRFHVKENMKNLLLNTRATYWLNVSSSALVHPKGHADAGQLQFAAGLGYVTPVKEFEDHVLTPNKVVELKLVSLNDVLNQLAGAYKETRELLNDDLKSLNFQLVTEYQVEGGPVAYSKVFKLSLPKFLKAL